MFALALLFSQGVASTLQSAESTSSIARFLATAQDLIDSEPDEFMEKLEAFDKALTECDGLDLLASHAETLQDVGRTIMDAYVTFNRNSIDVHAMLDAMDQMANQFRSNSGIFAWTNAMRRCYAVEVGGDSVATTVSPTEPQSIASKSSPGYAKIADLKDKIACAVCALDALKDKPGACSETDEFERDARAHAKSNSQFVQQCGQAVKEHLVYKWSQSVEQLDKIKYGLPDGENFMDTAPKGIKTWQVYQNYVFEKLNERGLAAKIRSHIEKLEKELSQLVSSTWDG